MRISDWSSDVCSSDLPFKGRRYKSPPLQGEGEQPSRVVIGRGRVRTIVLVELARQLQRRGVAVAGGQRLEVDRPQRCFLHDPQQAFIDQFQDRSEERREGKEWGSTCRSEGWTEHEKQHVKGTSVTV